MNYIIYHQIKPGTDCPDGICAAWVAAKALKEYTLVPDVYLNNAQYDSLDYRFPIQVTSEDSLYLVDFSYPKSILKWLIQNVLRVTILDHHISRMDDISAFAGRISGGYSADDCGATFAWRYFFPNKKEPWFLKHVRRRDVGADFYYDGATPESEAITATLSARRKGKTGESAFEVFEQALTQQPSELITEGRELLKERDVLCQLELEGWKNKYMRVGEYEVPVIRIFNPDADRHYSWLGTLLARKTNALFIAIITSQEPNKIHLRSLASGSNFDVGELAKKLGGGGHHNASGYLL